jgi:dolichol-phosphate mannosyltransferase
MTKRALITGGTGFVGANLARRLLQEGHEVHCLVRPGYQSWRIADISAHLHLYEVDFDDQSSLGKRVDLVRPDWVFHLAAYGAYSSQTDVRTMMQTNFTGTVNLVEACLKTGFEAFINAGSSSEYGFKDHAPVEDEWVDPNSHYAVTKVAATQFCRYTARTRQAPIITLRLYSVYGPYEEPTRLIPTLIVRGLESQFPPLVNPTVARDFVYTDDVSDAFLQAASQSDQEFGAVYNLGTGRQTTLHELVDVVRREFNIQTEPEWGSMPDRGWDTSVWVANNNAIRKALRWEPRHSLAEGLRSTMAWLRDHPQLLDFYRHKRNLPL